MDKKIFLTLMEVSAAHARRSREFFQKLDLSEGQPKVLYILRGKEGYLQKELAEICKISPPSMTVLLNNMEQKDLIRKEKVLVSGGKRASAVYFTDKGRHMAEEVYEMVEQLEEKAFLGFSSEERECVFQMLFRMTDNLNHK